MYQLALGASMELYEILSRSCVYPRSPTRTDARNAQLIRIQIRRIHPAFTAYDFSDSVIPERFYPSISLGTVRFSNRRESGRNSDWTPDPFDLAQGRGEHSRTTTKHSGVTT